MRAISLRWYGCTLAALVLWLAAGMAMERHHSTICLALTGFGWLAAEMGRRG